MSVNISLVSKSGAMLPDHLGGAPGMSGGAAISSRLALSSGNGVMVPMGGVDTIQKLKFSAGAKRRALVEGALPHLARLQANRAALLFPVALLYQTDSIVFPVI